MKLKDRFIYENPNANFEYQWWRDKYTTWLEDECMRLKNKLVDKILHPTDHLHNEEQKTEGLRIALELAEWSRKYPRGRTYHPSKQSKMDNELIALEERAKELVSDHLPEAGKGIDYNELIKLLKSDSVYYLLRYGVKSPSSSGMDDCKDDGYYDLYELSKKLREQEEFKTK